MTKHCRKYRISVKIKKAAVESDKYCGIFRGSTRLCDYLNSQQTVGRFLDPNQIIFDRVVSQFKGSNFLAIHHLFNISLSYDVKKSRSIAYKLDHNV